eukprot:m.348676 g.348676  ORF g.348676 m.348676 type:complete len:150 (-) comp20680_c0_seq2:448-897(-)
MEEFFGESHFGNGLSALPNHTVDGNDESIQSLKQMGARGTLAEINWTDNKDVDGAVLGLAAYLIGASQNQFYGAIGWYWNCHEIPVATLAPLVGQKLGKPTGDAASTVTPLPGKPGIARGNRALILCTNYRSVVWIVEQIVRRRTFKRS